MEKQKIAAFAFSGDPITFGHMNIIERASTLFDKLFVVVASYASKNYLFTLQERLELVKKVLDGIPNVEVVSCTWKVFTVNYLRELGVNVFVRGLRTFDDLKFEQNQEFFNLDIAREIETVYLTSPLELTNVSSSNVRAIAGIDPEWASQAKRLVPDIVLHALEEKTIQNQAKKHWAWLMNKLGLPGDANMNLYHEINKKYSEPGRFYHIVKHWVNVVDELMEVLDLLENKTIAVWAGIMHDWEYNPDPRRFAYKDQNEILSYEEACMLGDPIWYTKVFNKDKLEVAIMATTHKSVPDDNDAKYLVDADIAIFGRSKREFEEYCKCIRKEFAWVTDEVEYCNARADFLEKNFLKDRPTIYSTDYFRTKYEKKAQTNLKRHISELREYVHMAEELGPKATLNF